MTITNRDPIDGAIDITQLQGITPSSLTAGSAIVTDQSCRGRIGRVERIIEPPPLDAVFESGFYIPFNDVPLGDSEPQIVANGNLAVSWVGSTFEGSVDETDPTQPGPSRARIALNGAVTMELSTEAGADVSTTLRLALAQLPSFQFGAVSVSPFVEVRLHIEAAADTDGQISIVAPFLIGSRASYDGASDVTSTSKPRFDPQIGLPEVAGGLQASIEVEIVLVALMYIEEIIPLGGPVLSTRLGAVLTIDSAAGWDLDGTAEIRGGWAFPDPVNPPYPDVPDDLETLHEFALVDIAGGPFPVGAPSTRWSRLYETGQNSDCAAAIVQASDGLTMVGTDSFHWFASLDEFGVPLWQFTAAQGSNWLPAAMVQATNGDLFVAGVDGGVQQGNGMRLDRFNTQGEAQWTRTFQALNADGIEHVAIAPTATNGAVLAGRVSRNSVLTPILTAVDEDGNVDWSIEVDMGSGSTSPEIVALAATPTGEFIAVGRVDYTDYTDPVESPIDSHNALILRFSADGVLVGGFALGGIANNDEGVDVAVYPDGSYTVAGKLTDDARMTWLASINADDTLRWSAAYQSGPDGGLIDRSEPTGLATIDDRGLLVSGTIGTNSGTDAWLMRINREGMPIWVKTYSSTGTIDELTAVVALDDGVAACGRTYVTDNAHGDTWVLRGDVDAMLRFNPDSGLTTENTAAQWERITHHTLRALTPQPTNTTMVVDSNNSQLLDDATVTGELVTN